MPWLAVFFALLALGMIVGAHSYFGPALYETGDYAANALQIEQAKGLRELLGNYSRFTFHHPGPAFFYVYALGEYVFLDLLHVTAAPMNAHLLAGLVLQTALLTMSIATISQVLGRGRWTMSVLGLLVLVLVFRLTEAPQYSYWPPHQLVIPFFALLTAALAMSAGAVTAVPAAAVAAGFLLNGHLSQPLFVLPVLALATWFLVRRRADDGEGLRVAIMRDRKWYAASGVILSAFLLPIAIWVVHDVVFVAAGVAEHGVAGIRDATWWQPYNLAHVVGRFIEPADVPSWGGALGYVAALFALQGAGNAVIDPGHVVPELLTSWPVLAVELVVLLLPWGIMRSQRLRRDLEDDSGIPARNPLRHWYALLVLVGLLMIVWAKSQQGGLWAFNSYFFNAYLAALGLPLALVGSSLIARSRWARITTMAVAVAASALYVTTVPSVSLSDPTGPQLQTAAAWLASELGSQASVYLDMEQEDWPQAVGLALALEREGMRYLVPLRWGFMFGYDHVYPEGTVSVASPPVVLHLARPDGGAGLRTLTDRLELVSISRSGSVPP